MTLQEALIAERDDYKARAMMYERTNAEQAAMLNKVIAERDELLAACTVFVKALDKSTAALGEQMLALGVTSIPIAKEQADAFDAIDVFRAAIAKAKL